MTEENYPFIETCIRSTYKANKGTTEMITNRKILCYGDSNTYGYDPRSYFGGRYPDTVRWTALLKRMGWVVFNRGENGRSIPQHMWEYDTVVHALSQSQPDILTIMLGSNDLLQDPDISAEECAKRMSSFLSALLKQSPVCQILLIAPPPMISGTWVNDNRLLRTSQQLAIHYKMVAEKCEIHFADAGAWNIDLTFDGVHFSDAGHRTFAKETGMVLEQIMCKQKKII